MANRYWVGGSGQWTSSSTSHWSTSSGGSNGASVPTSSDDVFFDSASGGGTVTLQGVNANAQSLNFTGFTGALSLRSLSQLNIYGSLTFGSGMSFGSMLGGIYLYILGSGTITSNGKSISVGLFINVPGGTVNLGDAYLSPVLQLGAGTLNTNNFSVTTASYFYSGSATLNMGSSTWTCGSWSIGTGMTLNAGTSTISLSGSSFDGGSLTYNNLVVTRNNVVKIYGSNTFNNFSNTDPLVAVGFEASTTNTFNNFNINGSAGSAYLAAIYSQTNGVQFTLSKPSGVVNILYNQISDCKATGGAAWNTQYSTDYANNTGWNFGNAFAALL